MYQGYLIKVNGKIFPNSLLRASTYTITPEQQTDLDDYTDNDGILRRNPLPHTSTKIEFNLPTMHEWRMKIVRGLLPFSSPSERNVVDVEYFNPFTAEYQTMTAYIPAIGFSLYLADNTDIMYNEVRIALIEY